MFGLKLPFFCHGNLPGSLRLVLGKAVSVGQGVVNLACQVMGSVPRTWSRDPVVWMRDPVVWKGPNHAPPIAPGCYSIDRLGDFGRRSKRRVGVLCGWLSFSEFEFLGEISPVPQHGRVMNFMQRDVKG